jgi:hypothetical protein
MLNSEDNLEDPKVRIKSQISNLDNAIADIRNCENYEDIEFFLYKLLGFVRNKNHTIDLVNLKARIVTEIETEKYNSNTDNQKSNSGIPCILKYKYVLYVLENDPLFNSSTTNFSYDALEIYENI